MNDLPDRALHGVAIYNPRLLSKEELIGFFVARRKELERLVEALRREAKAQPQHHLVVGARGMGKTTLLNRLRYAIEDDEELATRCLGLVFPEEQYNVVCLADFWLNCVDALADGLESAGRLKLVEGLDDEIERLQALPQKDERGRRALALLCRLSDELDRRLVLLVDNVDLVLDRLEDEQWALREVLSSESRIQLIGATSAPLESQYRHDKAFYDFFRVHHLEGLDDEETFTVLRRLAEATGHESVARLLDETPSRVKTVRLMAGGNPRTIVMLFSVLAQGTEGDVRTDIERLLDQCTPLYKHRLEVLSTQAQQVLDALAKHWDPATAAEIAAVTHLQVNVVSTQLDRLVKDGTVEKVSLPDTKRQGFQIAERFFNIWCLMRASRRVRRRLVWLVEFLKLMFGAEELAQQAKRHLTVDRPGDAMRHVELGLALADIVGNTHLRTALETQSIRLLCSSVELRQQLGDLFDLEGQDEHLVGRAERLRLLAEARDAVLAAKVDRPDWNPEKTWEMLGGLFSLSTSTKHQEALDLLNHGSDPTCTMLRYFWLSEREGFLPGEYESLARATREGQIAIEDLSRDDIESASAVLNAPSLVACALGLAPHSRDFDFAWFDSEIRKSRSLSPWITWAAHAHRREVPTEDISREILRILHQHEWSEFGLVKIGMFLAHHSGVFPAIESAYANLARAATQFVMLAEAATFAMGRHWPEASALFVFSVTGRHVAFLDQNWFLVLNFFRCSVQHGFVAEARTLLSTLGPAERWEPLDRALEVVQQGDTSTLARVAPEMREAVRLVLAKISPETLKKASPSRSKRQSRDP